METTSTAATSLNLALAPRCWVSRSARPNLQSLPRHHLRQQPPVPVDRLPHRQPQLNLPTARRHRMHDGYTEVLLQEVDHRQHAPAGAEEVDCVGLAVLEEGALDVGVHLLGGKLADPFERDLDALHAEHHEAGLDAVPPARPGAWSA